MSKVVTLNAASFLVKKKNAVLIDVRSPAEFAHAHIPGAINFYLFDNAQRAEIGTLYKQHGRSVAMKRGLELYGANMQAIINQIEKHTTEKNLFVYCWRGGMRSGVVSWMLSLFGYHVNVLQGGYKSYRQLVLQTFEQQFPLVIVGGRTGAAKTLVIKNLMEKREPVIDLEGLAHHRGSAFGAIGLPAPPSQEQFENNFSEQLMQLQQSDYILLEDESQRIGHVNIPNAIWNQMRNAKVLYLNIDFEHRLEQLVNTYGKFPVEDLVAATIRIKKRLGGLDTQNAIQFLNQNNFEAAFRILLQYYDKVYDMATAKRNMQTIQHLQCTNVNANENASLILHFLNQKK